VERLNFDKHTIAIEKNKWEKNVVEEFTRLVEQSEQIRDPAREELETIDVGTKKDKKELKIGALITSSERKDLIALLREYVNVFAWFYADKILIL
jgi:hypothetical protein